MVLKQPDTFWFLQEVFEGFSPLVNMVLMQTPAAAELNACILFSANMSYILGKLHSPNWELNTIN